MRPARQSVVPIDDLGDGEDGISLDLEMLCDLVSGERLTVEDEDLPMAFVPSEDPRDDLKAARRLVKLAQNVLETIQEECEEIEEEEEAEESDDDLENDERDDDD